jgi:hypothetical protein
MFAINSVVQKSKIDNKKVTLNNLKNRLLQYDFEKDIVIKCIKDDLSCYVFLDNNKKEEKKKIDNLFNVIPQVYSNTKELDRLEFLDLNLEQLQRYEVFFEFSCKRDGRCSEIVVEFPNNVLVFNNIYKTALKFKELNDIDDMFDEMEKEVLDAF